MLGVSILALVTVTYHLSYYSIGPGPARSVDELIEIPADHAFPHKGQFLLPSVSLRGVTAFEAVRGWLDPDVDLVRARKVIGAPPSKKTRHQFDVKLRRDMTFSRQVAVEVALSRVGIPVPEPGQTARPGLPPFDVTIDTGETGGPSGGLALTLGVLDSLTSGDLTGGHRVAAAGSMFINGSVGDVDGIRQKAVGARTAGARYMLVAPRNYAEAVAHAGDRLTVLTVSDLDEAIAVLRGIGGELGSLRQPSSSDASSAR